MFDPAADEGHGGPFRRMLGRGLRNRLKSHLMRGGATEDEAEATLVEAESEYPLLDWFLQYGLKYIIDLLLALFTSRKQE